MSGFFREYFLKPLTRSSKWPKARRSHLKRKPYCANCGKKRRMGMQVHHIIPFSVAPQFELCWWNLLTLCSNPRCHLDKGHLGNFKSFNLNVVSDCKIWFEKYTNRP